MSSPERPGRRKFTLIEHPSLELRRFADAVGLPELREAFDVTAVKPNLEAVAVADVMEALQHVQDRVSAEEYVQNPHRLVTAYEVFDNNILTVAELYYNPSTGLLLPRTQLFQHQGQPWPDARAWASQMGYRITSEDCQTLSVHSSPLTEYADLLKKPLQVKGWIPQSRLATDREIIEEYRLRQPVVNDLLVSTGHADAVTPPGPVDIGQLRKQQLWSMMGAVVFNVEMRLAPDAGLVPEIVQAGLEVLKKLHLDTQFIAQALNDDQPSRQKMTVVGELLRQDATPADVAIKWHERYQQSNQTK